MNTTENPQHRDPAKPDPARLVPEETRERPEPVEATSTPEAVRAAQVARDDKQHTPAVASTSRPSWRAAPAPR
jgi:hypothetical protein